MRLGSCARRFGELRGHLHHLVLVLHAVQVEGELRGVEVEDELGVRAALVSGVGVDDAAEDAAWRHGAWPPGLQQQEVLLLLLLVQLWP